MATLLRICTKPFGALQLNHPSNRLAIRFLVSMDVKFLPPNDLSCTLGSTGHTTQPSKLDLFMTISCGLQAIRGAL
jgi:hypothetical protein